MGYMSQTLLRGVNFLSYDHTPELASNVWTIRLLGNVPLSQDAECRCISLAGNSSISLAGNEGQINFSQQSPKMLKMVSECFVAAFRSFSQNFFSGAPACKPTRKAVSPSRIFLVLGSSSLHVNSPIDTSIRKHCWHYH